MPKSGIEPKASSTAVKSQDQRYVANYKYLIIILLSKIGLLYQSLYKHKKNLLFKMT